MAGFGAFGKIPALGDFFQFGLPRSFIEPWDTWLQASLAHSKTSFDQDWDAAYMSAPIWRFTISAGLAGPAAMLGVLMVSVDRVGRKFPLTLAAPLTHSPNVDIVHKSATKLFQALEVTALDALEDGMTRDALATSLGHLPPFVPSADRAKIKRAIWSAALEDRSFFFQTSGLPNPRQCLALFDPNQHLNPVPA